MVTLYVVSTGSRLIPLRNQPGIPQFKYALTGYRFQLPGTKRCDVFRVTFKQYTLISIVRVGRVKTLHNKLPFKRAKRKSNDTLAGKR